MPDGSTVKDQSLDRVDEGSVTYWGGRAAETSNPLMRARYASLAWFFASYVDKTPDVKMARLTIGSLIDISNSYMGTDDTLLACIKLPRALEVAISINDSILIQRAKRAIIEFEESIVDDSKVGLWGLAYDILLDNGEVELTLGEELLIVGGLETRLGRLKDERDVGRAEIAYQRLFRYYDRHHDDEAKNRIVREFGTLMEN